MGFYQALRKRFNENKINQVINNKYYIEELNNIQYKIVYDYYIYILDNINIDKNNTQNSYIMWLCDKVNVLDMSQPAKIQKGHTSLADIDVDIPANKRDEIIEYIRNKYGADKVGQMIAIQSIKGRGALKAVLRAHSVVSATEMNKITRFFPEEHKIADELQEMKEEDGESSIIRWTLENDDKGELREWCFINEAGDLDGPLAKYFEQAIRLEGTKVHQSRHPAGILIADKPLDEICPLVYDSSTKTQIVGLEMNAAEAVGLIKFDLLGLSLLQKIMDIQQILQFGDVKDES